MIRFADEALITVSSGKGGNGCVAFRREKYVPNGGPSGGDGGRGGDLIFEIRRNLRTLAHLRYKQNFKAKNGLDGQGNKRFGADGEDCVVPLPPGCILKDADSGEILLDLGEAQAGRFVFLQGGNGGWGNVHFKGPANQAPRTALPGQPGESRRIRVELNIIADIGFVGFPNAGKSTLLDYFTNARPKIAPYPFTTKIPNLGVLRVEDLHDIVLADIPGIIEGASSGVGLGSRFLKHISRAVGLAFLIDLSDENYLKAYPLLQAELEGFSGSLAEKKRIVEQKSEEEGQKVENETTSNVSIVERETATSVPTEDDICERSKEEELFISWANRLKNEGYNVIGNWENWVSSGQWKNIAVASSVNGVDIRIVVEYYAKSKKIYFGIAKFNDEGKVSQELLNSETFQRIITENKLTVKNNEWWYCLKYSTFDKVFQEYLHLIKAIK